MHVSASTGQNGVLAIVAVITVLLLVKILIDYIQTGSICPSIFPQSRSPRIPSILPWSLSPSVRFENADSDSSSGAPLEPSLVELDQNEQLTLSYAIDISDLESSLIESKSDISDLESFHVESTAQPQGITSTDIAQSDIRLQDYREISDLELAGYSSTHRSSRSDTVPFIQETSLDYLQPHSCRLRGSSYVKFRFFDLHSRFHPAGAEEADQTRPTADTIHRSFPWTFLTRITRFEEVTETRPSDKRLQDAPHELTKADDGVEFAQTFSIFESILPEDLKKYSRLDRRSYEHLRNVPLEPRTVETSVGYGGNLFTNVLSVSSPARVSEAGQNEEVACVISILTPDLQGFWLKLFPGIREGH
ncbi:hypothetical protein R1flu_014797 [Riccia fluitans]|uniref:Uncharacterized protein n=1 Tax=Riccia fluitans TaxID=41844 RepID=A0ABD1YHI3_9MARC